MKWHKEIIDTTLVKDIAKSYSVSLLESSVLVRRGMTRGEDILFFLEKDFNYLHPPFMFLDMELAIDRIKEARAEKETILVYGDKDVDGVTSTTIMVRSLRNYGIETLWKVPIGILGYGLSTQDIDEAHEQGVTLIVTVDCGICNIEECDYANNLGIDMIVVDHHTPKKTLPDAVAIIDAKIENQTYPFDGMCAAAVTQKFHLALTFSETDIYNQDFVLMNIVPLHGSYKIELLSVRNLVVQWRKTLVVSPDNADYQLDEFANLLEGRQIIVFDKEMQTRLLYKAFGKVEFGCFDIQKEVSKHYKKFNGLSLLQIGERVRLTDYLDKEIEEIDLFYQLYKSVVYAEMPHLKKAFYEMSDLVAVATIADMMPLIGENRIIYNIGIGKITKNPESNLACLLEVIKISINDSIDSRTIGWKIGPIINSAGRMGQANLAVELLLAVDSAEAYQKANELVSLNYQRKKQMNEHKNQIRADIEKNLQEHKAFVMIYNASLPHAFTGIIASQYSREYGIPVVIIANRTDIILNGSIRCPEKFNAPLLIQELEPCILDGGGHKAAAGFSFLETNRKEVFRKLLNFLKTASVGYGGEEHNNIVVDLEIPSNYFNPTVLKNLQKKFEPYGEAWNTINVLFPDIKIFSCETVGKGNEHIKFVFQIGEYKIASFIWQFKEQGFVLETLLKAQVVNMVSNIKVDYYQGIPQLSLIIQDLDIVL